MTQATCIISVIIGLIICFFGYRLLRVCLFFCGAFLGFALVSLLTDNLIIIVAASAIVGLLSYIVYKIGIGLLGFILGYNFANNLTGLLNFLPPSWVPMIVGAAGFVLACVLYKYFAMIGTAYLGASQAVLGIFLLADPALMASTKSWATYEWVLHMNETAFIITIALAVVGTITQFGLIKGKRSSYMKKGHSQYWATPPG
ncbi:MAG: DUF4203 domain-containing protein [Christensenellales bacterium]